MYSILDATAGQAHLTQENNLIFTPKGFEYFEQIILLINSIKSELEEDIRKRDKSNEFVNHFKFENQIQAEVINLSPKTNKEEFENKCQFGDSDNQILESLIVKRKQLVDQNTAKKIEEFQKRKVELIQIGETLSKIKSKRSNDDIEFYNTLIQNYISLSKEAKKEGISSLELHSISGLGTEEWKEFIIKSHDYYNSLNQSQELENCLLCLQPLTDKEKNLYQSYWKLLKSEIQNQAKKAKDKISTTLKELSSIDDIDFTENKVIYKYISENHQEHLENIKQSVLECNSEKNKIKTSLINSTDSIPANNITVDLEIIREIIKQLDLRKKKLIDSNPEKEIAVFSKQIQEINDKKHLNQLAPSIIDWLDKVKWATNAKSSLSKLRTNAITKKQGELFKVHVTNLYKSRFDNECKLLKAPRVVEISQRNTRGSTLKRLVVAGRNANQILSEGEQKAISLADFLTEAFLDQNNRGIILDDPVTSLDYERREDIAKRLVEESKTRQVVIFTHDITFLLGLQYYSKLAGVDCKETHIRKFQDQIGIIDPQLPYIAQKVSSRIGYLKNYLVSIKKTESSGNVDEYTRQIKSWYGYLREGWERAIEERLFKGVIERFGVSVQSQKLKYIDITKDQIDQINFGMTESSKWLHDSAPGLAPEMPTSEDAEQALETLKDFCSKCKSN